MVSQKEFEVKEIRESMEVLRKEHHLELETLRAQNAEQVSKYNQLRLEKFTEFDKEHLVEDANIDAKYKIEILQKQIDEMRKLSKYQVTQQYTEVNIKLQSQVDFLENKCKVYLEEISNLKQSQQSFINSHTSKSENEVKYLREENMRLREHMERESPEIQYLKNEISSLREQNVHLKQESVEKAVITHSNDQENRINELIQETHSLKE